MWQRPGRRSLQQTEGNGRMIKRFLAVVMSVAMFGVLAPVADAQSSCPAEVAQAKDMFSKVAKAQDVQAPRSLAGARGQDTQAPRSQDVQAPRSLAGARGQDTQAPRSQDVQAPRSLAGARGQDTQAPRGQDTQAPRGQDTQAPRGQDTQAPRGQDTQAPRGDVQAPRASAGSNVGGGVSKAAQLVKDAEAACKAGDAKTDKD